MHWFAQAPSNIALIKYMGKKDSEKNIPANPSLSYTLENLLTSVELESCLLKSDRWEPLETPGSITFELSSKAQNRFLNHLDTIKRYFNFEGNFIVRSSNNFPLSSGLASSASSFAALTKCAIRAICNITGKALPAMSVYAELSRLGSGSSCRSFYAPWALWQDEVVTGIELPYQKLIHQAIIISHAPKSISSSQAHELIKSSIHYRGREQRAKDNLHLLIDAFNDQDWPLAYEVCWREFHDMHQLFQSSKHPFDYILPQSKEVLRLLQQFWQSNGDGPLVTMDAGPNIHLLYRENQQDLAMKFKRDHLIGNYDVL